MPTTISPGAPYHVIRVERLPNRWEVHCWLEDEGDVFTQAFDGVNAEADARELAAYLNAGGC